MFRKLICAGLLFLFGIGAVGATEVTGPPAQYDAASRLLRMPSVMVGNTVYKDVTVRLNDMAVTRALGPLGPLSSNPLTIFMAVYDDAKSELVLPSVVLNGADVYNNVGVRIGSMEILAVGQAITVPYTTTCTWDNFSQSKFSAIAPGMTYNQVLALVGCLPDPDGPSYLTDPNGKSSQAVWQYDWPKPGVQGEYVFGVFFDQPNGVVTGPEWLSAVPGSAHQHKWSMMYNY